MVQNHISRKPTERIYIHSIGGRFDNIPYMSGLHPLTRNRPPDGYLTEKIVFGVLVSIYIYIYTPFGQEIESSRNSLCPLHFIYIYIKPYELFFHPLGQQKKKTQQKFLLRVFYYTQNLHHYA